MDRTGRYPARTMKEDVMVRYEEIKNGRILDMDRRSNQSMEYPQEP